MPWGWVEGDPNVEARMAAAICHDYDLDGYIANAEDPYEFSGAWKSAEFVAAFRAVAPRAPLGLSFIGEGYPHRALDFTPWVRAGAAFLPQCYWSTAATGIGASWAAAQRAGLPLHRVFPTVGTSGFQTPYPAETYAAEIRHVGARSYSAWLLESTTDDYLRALQP